MTHTTIVIAALACATTIFLVQWLRTRAACQKLAGDIRRANDLALEQTESLQQRNQLDTLKDEFISTVSHELRTPLTSIRGALGLLSAGMLGKMDPKAQNLLRIASTNTDRLVRLINDILDLQRMDSGRAPLQMHRCSLAELEAQAVETMTPMAQAANVSIEIVQPSDREAIVFDGDPDRILQVLCNLLSNAIKFSPASATVRVQSSEAGNDLLLRVEDNGRGIPAEKLESIFDRFQQVDPSDSRQKGGTGLGLAICRSIATQHGGAIWAERNDATRPGQPGSTFTLRLPRVTLRNDARPAPLRSSGTILVCDDDGGIRHIVAEQLRGHGYHVLEAESGEHALVMAEREQVEAILLDLYMPGISGWETLERLKANAATAEIPVVILSVLPPAAREREDPAATGAAAAGAAQGWVTKPFSDKRLLAELGRVLHYGDGPARVLLVEDDADLATVVLSGFEQHASESGLPSGLVLEHAASLQEAKICCLQKPPDILILDLALPDGSGYAFVHWLRQQPTLCTLPLVVYSGSDVNEGEMEQLRLGPTQFLAKTRVQPQEVEELVAAMVRTLRTSALPQPQPSSPSTLHHGTQP